MGVAEFFCKWLRPDILEAPQAAWMEPDKVDADTKEKKESGPTAGPNFDVDEVTYVSKDVLLRLKARIEAGHSLCQEDLDTLPDVNSLHQDSVVVPFDVKCIEKLTEVAESSHADACNRMFL